jgi:hypothetical protein
MDEVNPADDKLFLMRILYWIFLPFGSISIATFIANMATRNDSNFEGARAYGFFVLARPDN